MKIFISFAFVAFVLAACDAKIFAAELTVGPNQLVTRLEDALAKASPGDVIVVQPPPGNQAYEKVALFVDKPHITIRAAGSAGARVALSGRGFNYTGHGSVPRAIVQFNASAGGCVLEGFELFGAHNESHNGAGVRINQANDVTIRNCEIHDNDMGLMSNGDDTLDRARNQRIETCIIHHNGDKGDPGYNHNLYLGGTSVTLTGCEVYASLTGHNVKSRAHKIEVRDCSIHDSANREFDLVDAPETAFPGSDALLVGNKIIKALNCRGNGGVIDFGQDGGKPHNGTLRLERNIILTPFISPVVQLSAPQARVVINQNIIQNSGSQKSGQILVDFGISTEPDAMLGQDNQISASFTGPASGVQKLEHTTLLNSMPP